MRRSILFIVDFDGTVAPVDTVDALLEGFADPQWRRLEEQWVRGEIDSRQCMSAQLALVRADRSTIEAFLDSVVVDPAFPQFVRYVSPFADIVIVSDGIDYPIRRALERLDLPLPFYGNAVEFLPRGLTLRFPYADRDCRVQSGLCKCAVTRSVDAGRGLTTVLIGDGLSDRCVARSVDFIFAKASLRDYCESEGIPYSPFEGFSDVLTAVQSWTPDRFEQRQERVCP